MPNWPPHLQRDTPAQIKPWLFFIYCKIYFKLTYVTILQGVEFSIFLLIFEWALQQCSATVLPVMTLTFSGYGSLDCDERHVTALQPINRARCCWSHDSIQMTHDSRCNITHMNNVISWELMKCKCNTRTHERRHHTYHSTSTSTDTRAASELIAETAQKSLQH